MIITFTNWQMITRSSLPDTNWRKKANCLKDFEYPIEQKQLNTVNSIETYYYYFH